MSRQGIQPEQIHECGFAGLLLSALLAFGLGLASYNDVIKSNVIGYYSPSVVGVELARQLTQSGVRYSKQLISNPNELDALIKEYQSDPLVVIECDNGNQAPSHMEPIKTIKTLITPESNQEILIKGIFSPNDCSKNVSVNNYRLAFKITGGVNCNQGASTNNNTCIARSSMLSAAQAPMGVGCVWALSQNSPAYLFNSGNTIDGKTCEFHAHATGNASVIWNNGNNVSLSQLFTKGGILANGGREPWFNEYAGNKVQNDPFERGLPQPVGLPCSYNNFNANGTVTLSPGVYCGSTNLNANGATVRLLPGLYVLRNGDFNINGGNVLADNGVTIFHETPNRLALNGQSSLTIVAPTSGPYAGLAVYEKYNMAGGGSYPIDARGGMAIEGLIYLPSKSLIFNSGSTLRSNSLKVVAQTIHFSGTNWILAPFAGTIAGGLGDGGSGEASSIPVIGK